MGILFLCVVSLLATVAAWVYLDMQERQAGEKSNEDGSATTEISVLNKVNIQDKRLLIPEKKRLAFLIVMAVGLCGMSVALEILYPGNTLVENSKLVVLLAILFVAAAIDARQRIIPNVLVLTGIVLRVIFWCVELVSVPGNFWAIIKSDLIACVLVVLFFVVGVLMVKGGLGMGDIKLMLVMCLFQGFYGVVSSLFCALFMAFIYALFVLITKRKTKKDSVAFAPAILLGTALSIFLTGM